MDTHFTARRFKARSELKTYALAEVNKLDRFYDGIVRVDVILSFERTTQSVKSAEINLHVHGSVLSARESSEEFHKSIDLAIGKLERQLTKYKARLRMKNKQALRAVKENIRPLHRGDDA